MSDREFGDIATFFIGDDNLDNRNQLYAFLKDLIQEPKGKTYTVYVKNLRPILAKNGISLPEEDNLAREHFGKLFRNMPRKSSKGLILSLIEWMCTQYNERFYEFIKEIGIEIDISGHKKISYDAFVAWSGDYGKALAATIKSFFDQFNGKFNVFMSSDNITRDDWRGAISNSIFRSSTGLVIVTQDVMDSPYVFHEFSAFSAPNREATVLRFKAPLEILPEPMRWFQAPEYSPHILAQWIGSVLGKKDVVARTGQLDALMEQIDKIMAQYSGQFVTDEPERWAENYGRPLLMASQNTSPYDIEQLFRVAKSEITLVAQNHYFLTSAQSNGSERFWPQLEMLLKRGVSIDLVSMHKDVPPPKYASDKVTSAAEVWSHYMGAPQFHQHLEECWDTLEIWANRHAELCGKYDSVADLRIYGAYFTPLTVSIVDPNDSSGFLVLSPRTGHEASGTRPHFIVRRRHEATAFNYYNETIRNGIANGGWRRMFQG